MSVSKPCIFTGNNQITGQGKLQSTGITMAVYRRNHGLRQSGEAFDDFGLEIRTRQLLPRRNIT